MNYSICIGEGATADAEYAFSANFAGVGIRSTILSPAEHEVLEEVVHRMLGISQYDRHVLNRKPRPGG